MKNNIGFFSHYTDAPGNGKFILLHASYPDIEKGLAAEARFWRLNCLIGAAPEAKLDLSIPKNRAEAIKATMLNLVDFRAFIELLASSDIDLIHKDGEIIWTEQTQEDLARAMATRTDAQKRREGKKKSATVNDAEKSGDDLQESDDADHGQEQPGQDRKGAAAAAAAVELSTGEEPEEPRAAPPGSGALQEDDLRAFASWALERALEIPGVKWPAKYAERIMADPARFEEFKLSRSPPPEPSYPDPGDCPECGGDLMRPIGRGAEVRRCMRCGREYEYQEPDGWTAAARNEKRVEEAVS